MTHKDRFNNIVEPFVKPINCRNKPRKFNLNIFLFGPQSKTTPGANFDEYSFLLQNKYARGMPE